MNSLIMMLTLALILSFSVSIVVAKRCPDCGRTRVPYPLSTGPGCGDQSYKVQCNAGTLRLKALNDLSYVIASVNPLTQLLIIRPPGLAKNTCMAADFWSQGILLDDNLPFNITSSNTVFLMNCSSEMLQLSMNCSSTSVCHNFVRDNAAVAAACTRASSLCCWYKTGGSGSAYKMRVRKERCSAYESFVNLDMSLPVSKWPEPGVEIEWASPKEPLCKMPVDCRDLVNSVCLLDPASAGQRRCLCKAGFRWDPINGVCINVKCPHGTRCKRRKSRTALLGGASAAGAMLLGALVAAIVYKQRQRARREATQSIASARKVRKDNILNANNSWKSTRIFLAKEITKATNNFSRDKLLGSGGFGEVFKGTLDDGTHIAVKRAKLGSTKGSDQILNEVRILCQVNHRSLVRFLGCCVELDQPVLIYEYIPNGSLFDHLHGTRSAKRASLTWRRRLSIAHQTADGLAYLHNSAVPRIYHRDIKSSNILIDEKLDARVSDFGLSRLAVTETSHVSTSAQGTLGYLDPQYYLNFQLTDKSDVYSFGVVLLELLTSEKAIDFNREEEDVNLVVFMKKIIREDKLMDAVDPELKEGASKVELETMKALGSLAAACLAEDRTNRPSMKDAADEIEYIFRIVTSHEVSAT
ncbi:hypothetical protein I3843_09G194100 [Carya illinoinensis]|nr:hypothetical protein I3843_09G194100 [Carya illinoinensis]